MSMTRRSLFALVAASSLFAGWGCSGGSTTPELIEGKTPADYREEAEKNALNAIPKTPAGGAGTTSKRRD